MGGHWTREGNACPPSLIHAGIPLGVPRGEILGPIEAIRFKDDCLNDCKGAALANSIARGLRVLLSRRLPRALPHAL